MIAINLSKQGLDADAKSIPRIDFTANLERDGNENATTFSFLLKIQKELFQIFHKEL